MQEERIRNKITLITFICSVFVVYIHAYNLTTYGIDSNSTGISLAVYTIEEYCSKVTHLAVPMFFFISGFLFFRNFEIDMLFKKWKKRFFTVAIPYILWCTVYYIYNVMCTNLPIIRAHMNTNTVVKWSFPVGIDALWNNSYYTLWFLKNLIIFIAIAPIIWALIKEHFNHIPLGLIMLVIIELLIEYGVFPRIELIQGLDIYLVGGYIGLNAEKFLQCKNRTLTIVSMIFIILVLLEKFKWWNLGIEILFFIAVWYALDFWEMRRPLPWWMSITFFYYVAHDILLEALEKIFLISFGVNPVCALLDYMFMPCLVIGGLIIIAYFLQTYFPMVWKVLTGGRGIYKKT